MTSMWEYDPSMGHGQLDLVGFEVEATDGSIGTIAESSQRAGAAYLVVDAGSWIVGEKRLIPAGVVRVVNELERTVQVSLTKDEIRSAPDFQDQDRDSPALAYDAYYRRFVR